MSVNEREEPAPCPWCGDEPLVTDESVRLPARGGWGVLCIDGGCNTNPHTFAPTRAEAVEQWNTRSKPRSPAPNVPDFMLFRRVCNGHLGLSCREVKKEPCAYCARLESIIAACVAHSVSGGAQTASALDGVSGRPPAEVPPNWPDEVREALRELNKVRGDQASKFNPALTKVLAAVWRSAQQ